MVGSYSILFTDGYFQGSFGLEFIMFSVSLPVNTILHKQRAAGEKKGFLEAKTSIFEVINTRYTSKINQKAYRKLRRRRDFFLDLMIF